MNSSQHAASVMCKQHLVLIIEKLCRKVCSFKLQSPYIQTYLTICGCLRLRYKVLDALLLKSAAAFNSEQFISLSEQRQQQCSPHLTGYFTSKHRNNLANFSNNSQQN